MDLGSSDVDEDVTRKHVFNCWGGRMDGYGRAGAVLGGGHPFAAPSGAGSSLDWGNRRKDGKFMTVGHAGGWGGIPSRGPPAPAGGRSRPWPCVAGAPVRQPSPASPRTPLGSAAHGSTPRVVAGFPSHLRASPSSSLPSTAVGDGAFCSTPLQSGGRPLFIALPPSPRPGPLFLTPPTSSACTSPAAAACSAPPMARNGGETGGAASDGRSVRSQRSADRPPTGVDGTTLDGSMGGPTSPVNMSSTASSNGPQLEWASQVPETQPFSPLARELGVCSVPESGGMGRNRSAPRVHPRVQFGKGTERGDSPKGNIPLICGTGSSGRIGRIARNASLMKASARANHGQLATSTHGGSVRRRRRRLRPGSAATSEQDGGQDGARAARRRGPEQCGGAGRLPVGASGAAAAGEQRRRRPRSRRRPGRGRSSAAEQDGCRRGLAARRRPRSRTVARTGPKQGGGRSSAACVI